MLELIIIPLILMAEAVSIIATWAFEIVIMVIGGFCVGVYYLASWIVETLADIITSDFWPEFWKTFGPPPRK